MSVGFWRLTALVAVLAVVGCGGKKSPRSGDSKSAKPAIDLTEEELFQRGKELVERGKHNDGRVMLRRYEQRYPKGPHIEEAKLLIADSFFHAAELDQQVEGVALYRQFLSFYPQHQLACTAQLRIGEYYFEQMRSCERDQTETRQAVEEFQKMLVTFPDCADAEAARVKLQRAYGRLACAELKVAEFYRRTGEPGAALGRLTELLEAYPEFAGRCGAQRLRVDILEDIGELDEARKELALMETACASDPELNRARKILGIAAQPLAENAVPEESKSAKKKPKKEKKQKKEKKDKKARGDESGAGAAPASDEPSGGVTPDASEPAATTP